MVCMMRVCISISTAPVQPQYASVQYQHGINTNVNKSLRFRRRPTTRQRRCSFLSNIHCLHRCAIRYLPDQYVPLSLPDYKEALHRPAALSILHREVKLISTLCSCVLLLLRRCLSLLLLLLSPLLSSIAIVAAGAANRTRPTAHPLPCDRHRL